MLYWNTNSIYVNAGNLSRDSGYFFQKQQVYKSALYFAIAVGAKLIPLIFLPLFLKQLGFKKFIPFAIIVCLLPALSFVAFYEPNLFQNISSSFLFSNRI